MKEKLSMLKAPVWIAAAVLLVAIAVIMALRTSRDEEPAEMAPVAVDVQGTSEPTVPPPTSELEVASTLEPAAEDVAEADPVVTQTPLTTVVELEEYVSTTHSFRVLVPAGWSATESFPGAAIVMANSEAALERFSSEDSVARGDVVLNVGFLPFELFRQREIVPLNIQFEAPPDVFMQSILPVFRTSSDALLGEVELVSLSNERDAGRMSVADGDREGLILMFMAGEEVVAVVSAIGLSGEIDAIQETIFSVAAGISFSGDQGALYGALLEG